MKNVFTKDFKFSNVLYLACTLFLFILSLSRIILSLPTKELSILLNQVGTIVLLIVALILTAVEVFYLVLKNKKKLTPMLCKIKRIAYLVTIFITILVLCEIIIFSIILSFKLALSFGNKRPSSDYSLLVRLSYILITKYSDILAGVGVTLLLSLAGTIIGLLIALLFIKLKKTEIKTTDNEVVVFFKKIGIGFVNLYVTVFRGTPMMVQAIIIYYFLPGIICGIFKVDQQIVNQILSVTVSGLITVSLNTAAYLTEVLRGGIESLNNGQYEAARSLGMKRGQALRYVVMPQAIKNSLPSICNEFIINIKDTSVLSVISVVDLFYVIKQINGKQANQDAIFIAAAIYLILTVGISKLLGLIEKRMRLVAKPVPSSN